MFDNIKAAWRRFTVRREVETQARKSLLEMNCDELEALNHELQREQDAIREKRMAIVAEVRRKLNAGER